ncbi:C4-dicarboxylate TRAP transporter substrate-binding protein [Ammoniphilus sp. 3BR4]|uniref:C4-dicarboxylate TRAP transporter substrate-binding protein n=1 Tax=Ammoniphilus sp. 3BR4 TaxID=3158265 RepID=UPI003465CE12
MKKFTGLLSAVLVTSLVLAGCGNSAPEATGDAKAGSDTVYTLKMSTQMADTHPMVEGFHQLAKRLDEKTNGRIKMEVYTSAQLGSDEDVIEQAIQGVNVAVLTDGGRMGNYVKDIGIIGAPYLTDNYEEVLKITQGDTFKSWEKELAEQNGIRVLSFNWYDGARHFLTNKPVKSPEDLDGLRIRTPGAPVWAESVKAMGAIPVAMPWPESYTAVQQGAIDGAEAQHTATYASRMYEVVKYVNKTGHFQLVNGIIVGEKWFDTLPEDLQNILMEETKAVAEENAKHIASLSQEFEEKMKAEGMEVVEVDVEAFKAAADKAYEVLGLKELREKIYAEIGK